MWAVIRHSNYRKEVSMDILNITSCLDHAKRLALKHANDNYEGEEEGSIISTSLKDKSLTINSNYYVTHDDSYDIYAVIKLPEIEEKDE